MSHAKETSSEREAKLKTVTEQARLLHRERDKALDKLKILGLQTEIKEPKLVMVCLQMSSFIHANLRISQGEAKEFEDKFEKAEVEVSRFVKELEETKRELKLLENHDMIVSLGYAAVVCHEATGALDFQRVSLKVSAKVNIVSRMPGLLGSFRLQGTSSWKDSVCTARL